MNEQKIIDLVNRIADNDKVAPFQNGFVVLSNEEMVRYTELIVRECSGILREEATSNWEGREERLLNAMANWIEEHFGVEE